MSHASLDDADEGLPGPPELSPAEIRERFGWARERGRPRHLWPDIPPGRLAEALEEVTGCVRSVLAGRPGRLGTPPAGDGDGVRAVGVAAFVSGTGPLLGHWIEHGEVDAPAALAALLALHLEHGRDRSARFDGILARAGRALAGPGIAAVVLKSAHTERIYFPAPGCRPAADVDLLVEADAFSRAEAALEAAGFRRTGGQRSPRKSDWRPPGGGGALRSLELSHRDGPYALDLHASPDRDFYGVRRAAFGPLLAGRTAPFPEAVEGADLRVLTQPLLLAHAAVHASEALENLTLIRLVEIVLMARRDVPRGELDWGELEAVLDAADALPLAYPALALAERLAPGTVDGALLRRAGDAGPGAVRDFVDGLAPERLPLPADVPFRQRFMWCEGPADVARRLAHMAVPSSRGQTLGGLFDLYRERLLRVVRGGSGAG